MGRMQVNEYSSRCWLERLFETPQDRLWRAIDFEGYRFSGEVSEQIDINAGVSAEERAKRIYEL